MEIGLENMIMSEEQAHLFAVDIYNEVVQYFKELDKYFGELVYKSIVSIAGVLAERNNSYQYNLCNYS